MKSSFYHANGEALIYKGHENVLLQSYMLVLVLHQRFLFGPLNMMVFKSPPSAVYEQNLKGRGHSKVIYILKLSQFQHIYLTVKISNGKSVCFPAEFQFALVVRLLGLWNLKGPNDLRPLIGCAKSLMMFCYVFMFSSISSNYPFDGIYSQDSLLCNLFGFWLLKVALVEAVTL